MNVSQGESTTLILPSDLTDIASIASTFGLTKNKLEETSTKNKKTSKAKTSNSKKSSTSKSKNLEKIIESVKK